MNEEKWCGYEFDVLQGLKKGWYLLSHGWEPEEGTSMSPVYFDGAKFDITKGLGCLIAVYNKAHETEADAFAFLDSKILE